MSINTAINVTSGSKLEKSFKVPQQSLPNDPVVLIKTLLANTHVSMKWNYQLLQFTFEVCRIRHCCNFDFFLR